MNYCANCISYDYCSARGMCMDPPFGYCTLYQPKRMSLYSSTMFTEYGIKMGKVEDKTDRYRAKVDEVNDNETS